MLVCVRLFLFDINEFILCLTLFLANVLNIISISEGQPVMRGHATRGVANEGGRGRGTRGRRMRSKYPYARYS